MLVEAQTTTPFTVADIAARRAVAAAEAGTPRSSRTTALDRAIAAAEAFVPEFLRVCDQDDEAQERAYDVNAALKEQKEAAKAYADQAEPRPDLLKFRCDPDRDLVGMVLRYASGREEVCGSPGSGFYEPDQRSSLECHCSEAGLDPQPYLAAWDAWEMRRHSAFLRAMPQEWRDAEAEEEAAAKAWNAAYEQLNRLATRLLKARAPTPADLMRKVQAYARLTERTKFDLCLIEAEDILKMLVKGIDRMSGPPARKNLQLVG